MRFALFLFALIMCAPAFAADGIDIVVPARDIARGETISASDLSVLKVPDQTVVDGVVTTANALVGHEARRYLRAGEAVRTSDVRMPIVVTKGSTVTMTFKAPGITLTGVGKAMSEGGMGEMVTVLNPVSYRQVTCVVTGPGQVEAGPPQPFAANMSERVAVAQPVIQGTTQ